jgi:hypothetical protein
VNAAQEALIGSTVLCVSGRELMTPAALPFPV